MKNTYTCLVAADGIAGVTEAVLITCSLMPGVDVENGREVGEPVTEGGAGIVAAIFVVGDGVGAVVRIGMIVGFGAEGVGVRIDGGFVPGIRVAVLGLGDEIARVKPVGAGIAGGPWVRPIPMTTTAAATRSTLNPNIQRARTTYPCLERKFAIRRLA